MDYKFYFIPRALQSVKKIIMLMVSCMAQRSYIIILENNGKIIIMWMVNCMENSWDIIQMDSYKKVKNISMALSMENG